MNTPSASRLVAVAAALVLVAGAFTVPVARLPFAGLYTLFAYRPTAAVVLVVLAVLTAALALRGTPRWTVALATGAAYVVARTWWQVAHEHAPSRAERGIDAITSRVPGAIVTQWGLWVLLAAALVLLASAVALASGEARRGR